MTAFYINGEKGVDWVDSIDASCKCLREDYTEDDGSIRFIPICHSFVPMEGRPYRKICKNCDHYRECHKGMA